jgi:hypothetical protein
MSKQIVHMRIDEEIKSAVKRLADNEYEGNFTAAVECLLAQSLRMRMIDLTTRWEMYGAAKNAKSKVVMDDKQYNEFIRKLTDGLFI